jgi:hypothetical protein
MSGRGLRGPLLFVCLAYSSVLKMEVARSSETLLNFCQTTRCNVSEDCHKSPAWEHQISQEYGVSYFYSAPYTKKESV